MRNLVRYTRISTTIWYFGNMTSIGPDMGFKHHPFYVDIMEYDGMYKQHYGSLWYFGSFEEKGVTFQ